MKYTSKLEIEREMHIIDPSRHHILNILQKPILAIEKLPFFKNIISKMHLIFIGGSVELIGIKKMEYKRQKLDNRDVVPIDMQTLNVQQIEFYRRDLIPKVLKVFSETYEKFKEGD